MLSNQIIQKSIDELKSITKVELEIYDLEGTKIAGTSSETDVESHIIRFFAESAAETQELENKRFMKIQDEGRDIYVLRGDERYAAKAVDIDDSGSLVVLTESGERQLLHSGEVSLRFE